MTRRVVNAPNSPRSLQNCPKISHNVPKCQKMSNSDASLSEGTCWLVNIIGLKISVIRIIFMFLKIETRKSSEDDGLMMKLKRSKIRNREF